MRVNERINGIRSPEGAGISLPAVMDGRWHRMDLRRPGPGVRTSRSVLSSPATAGPQRRALLLQLAVVRAGRPVQHAGSALPAAPPRPHGLYPPQIGRAHV